MRIREILKEAKIPVIKYKWLPDNEIKDRDIYVVTYSEFPDLQVGERFDDEDLASLINSPSIEMKDITDYEN